MAREAAGISVEGLRLRLLEEQLDFVDELHPVLLDHHHVCAFPKRSAGAVETRIARPHHAWTAPATI